MPAEFWAACRFRQYLHPLKYTQAWMSYHLELQQRIVANDGVTAQR